MRNELPVEELYDEYLRIIVPAASHADVNNASHSRLILSP